MITDAHARRYETEGYFLAQRVIPDGTVSSLREECARFMAEMDRQFDEEGIT
jgi:hypothetical protein